MSGKEKFLYTTAEGEKVYGTRGPSESSKKSLEDQQNADFELSRKFGNARAPEGLGTAQNLAAEIKARMDAARSVDVDKGKIKHMPSRKEEGERPEFRKAA